MILAIDQGTTNTKALLVDRSGRASARTSVRMTVLTPRFNWVEQDPEAVWSSVVTAAKQCAAHAADARIEAIAISNQRETVVAWDRKTGAPLAPAILWQCRRSESICEKLRADGLEPELLARTGLAVDTLFSASKMRWLLENIPGLSAKALNGEVCFGTIDSWLIWKLTAGRIHASDASNASRTQLLNLASREWDDELLKIFGIPRAALPQVHDSSGEFDRCTTIAELKDIPILSALGDSHAAMAGHGSYQSGTAKATYGTGSSLMTLMPQLEPARGGIAATVAWSLGGMTQYALEGNITMTGAGVAWVGEFLGLKQPVEDAIQLAATVPSSDGVYFVPAMSGLGAPYWDGGARGTITGLTRTSRSAHLARAAVEAIAFQIRDVFDAMAAASGCDLPALHADGGATRNNELMQLQADVLQKPVIRSACEDLSALGAAWFAGLALGWWKSTSELERLPQETDAFIPRRDPSEMESLYAAWRTAVARARLRDLPEVPRHV